MAKHSGAWLTDWHLASQDGKLKEAETEYDEKGRPKRRKKQSIEYSAFLDDGNENCSPEALDEFLDAIQRRQETPTV